MALCHLPSITCTTHKLHRSFSSPFLTTSDDHHHHLRWRALHRTGCRGGDGAATFVCSAKKPRARKKVKLPTPNMSDAELCSELREFVAREGLPGNHIPSMTELSKRGRKDLANIVRRKGYKVVTELLRNQTNDKILSERNEELLTNKTNDNIQSDRNEEILANQSNDKIQSERNEELLTNKTNDKIQSDRNKELLANQSNDKIQSERNEELLMNQTNDEIQSERREELLTNHRNDEILSERNKELLRNQTSYDIQLKRNNELLRNQTKDKILSERNLIQNQDSANNKLEFSEFLDRSFNVLVEDVSSSWLSLMKNYVHSKIGELAVSACLQNGKSSEHLVGISSHGNSGKLMQYEKSESGSLNRGQISSHEDQISESKASYDILVSNGIEKGPVILQEATFVSSEQFSLRGNASANEAHSRDDVDIISEVGKVDEETEISCLKTMLRQKEMELLLLKQEIEKEKLALSTLQKKANAEISNVHSIVSAKDSELRAVEEGLLGLKEVLIEYHAHGQSVEVTGSFNGWHHRVKMDYHSSSNAVGFSEIRESSRWTVTLWLYPGIYEIKFIVDGDWRIDSQREMLTRGHITNNILRVEENVMDIISSYNSS